jgi:hypothetical protein
MADEKAKDLHVAVGNKYASEEVRVKVRDAMKKALETELATGVKRQVGEAGFGSSSVMI